MVELNFDRARPDALLNLNEVAELRGYEHEAGTLRLGAGLTYTEAMRGELAERLPALAEAARTVGGPQIRNRGTIGGNLGTASPAGDALPPLLVSGTEVEVASVRGTRRVQLAEFLVGPKRNSLAPDELLVEVALSTREAPGKIREVARRPGDFAPPLTARARPPPSRVAAPTRPARRHRHLSRHRTHRRADDGKPQLRQLLRCAWPR